jgi:hypothetical protein
MCNLAWGMAHGVQLDGRSGETSETGLVDGGHKLDDFGFRIAESAFHSMPHAPCPMLYAFPYLTSLRVEAPVFRRSPHSPGREGFPHPVPRFQPFSPD